MLAPRYTGLFGLPTAGFVLLLEEPLQNRLLLTDGHRSPLKHQKRIGIAPKSRHGLVAFFFFAAG